MLLSWGVFEEDGQKNPECTHSRRVEFHWRLEHFPDAFGDAVRVSVRSFYGNWPGLSASGPCLNSLPWPKQECIAGDHSLCSHLSFPGILHLEFQIYQLYRENLLTDLCRYIRKWNKHCLWSSIFLLCSEILMNENRNADGASSPLLYFQVQLL